jgi:hypothetical protein
LWGETEAATGQGSVDGGAWVYCPESGANLGHVESGVCIIELIFLIFLHFITKITAPNNFFAKRHSTAG